MGYRLNRLDKPVFRAVPKPLLMEFCIHYRLESCEVLFFDQNEIMPIRRTHVQFHSFGMIKFEIIPTEPNLSITFTYF